MTRPRPDGSTLQAGRFDRHCRVTAVVQGMLDLRRNIALACALSLLAGYVDGIGFLHLGGLFVSFMSGNSTRLGVSLAEAQWWQAASARPDRAVRGRSRGRQPGRARRRAERQPSGCSSLKPGCLRRAGLGHRLRPVDPRDRGHRARDGAWRTPCSRSTAARASASPMSRARWSRSASSSRLSLDRGAARGMAAEPAAVGRRSLPALGGRRAGLCPDSTSPRSGSPLPRRLLWPRSWPRRGRPRLDRAGGREMDRLEHDPRDR